MAERALPSQSERYVDLVHTVLEDADAKTTILREAIQAEMTHGGIIDRIAHETSIIGAYCHGEVDADDAQKIREAAGRLDTARSEFTARMEVALGVVSA